MDGESTTLSTVYFNHNHNHNLLDRYHNPLTVEQPSLRKKCQYLELFWSTFSRIWTEYGEIRTISPYSIRMQEYTDQNNSRYGHVLRSAWSHISLSLNIFKSLLDHTKLILRLVLKFAHFDPKLTTVFHYSWSSSFPNVEI